MMQADAGTIREEGHRFNEISLAWMLRG
ncbi:hypothetical protein SMD44_p20035 (plasmid) [Streptomyces alboflavus]|uniref:Uncharacterized protein n=1 Tax=Streptomyces alboflavus TaxID=67267 RepID=A0A291W472_9ACTN|nr:hypothetical protein SMD44_p20035 [Streptomyces alboflavus]